jgi:hypothetical protein
MSDLKLKQLQDKLEEMEHKQNLIIDLLYTIRTSVLDKETHEKEIDTSFWMYRFSELYPSMMKFKQMCQKTYMSHDDMMYKLSEIANKYREDFDGLQDEKGFYPREYDEDNTEPNYPME